MSKWLFVGPVPLSGIGQVMSKYARLFEAEYISFQETATKPYDKVFAFIIPQKETFDFIVKKFKPDVVMTVCETEPVHENYKMIFDTFQTVLTPSQFCKDVFQKQFGVSTIVFPHWPGDVIPVSPKPRLTPYTFYTIGNIIDPRKNIQMLIDAFIKCNFQNARLVLKATCIQDVQLKLPNVLVLNGLMSEDDLEIIHDSCDCYVNCSHSEGAGMGAIEAAVRNKPVIITDFGGLKEYVKTPFVVPCTETTIGKYDFLFEPHMKWGNPDFESLVRHMKYCYEHNIREWDHQYTREFTLGSMLRAKLTNLGSTLTRSSV